MPRRFRKLTQASLSERQREVIEQIRGFSINAMRGPFDMMLRSPEATARFQRMGEYLRFETGIDDALVELAVLVHARVWNDDYEWKLHAPRALDAGLSDALVDALRVGTTPRGMSDLQEAVFGYVAELEVMRDITDATFARAEKLLGEQAMADLVFMLGQYATISMMLAVSSDDDDSEAQPLLRCARPFADYFA
jgi:4-carboxymuconolactone decarboxylase